MAASPSEVLTLDANDGVDVTLIRWMLSLSPEERLAVLQGFVDSVLELTHDSPAPRFREALEILAAHRVDRARLTPSKAE